MARFFVTRVAALSESDSFVDLASAAFGVIFLSATRLTSRIPLGIPRTDPRILPPSAPGRSCRASQVPL